jgi:hypothetical protein
VDERVLWWSGGQTCYQVPLSTIDKLVVLNHEMNISHSSAFKASGTIHTAHTSHGWLVRQTGTRTRTNRHCNLLLNHETNIGHSSASKGSGAIRTAHPNHGWLDKLELGQGSQDKRVF